MNSGFANDWRLRGAARSAPEERTLHAAALFVTGVVTPLVNILVNMYNNLYEFVQP
jgi:hypothetical protein